MFDLRDAAGVLHEINECREAYPGRYIRVNVYDASRRAADDRAVLHRQPARPKSRDSGSIGRRLADRRIRYTTHSYATERPAGDRYRQP